MKLQFTLKRSLAATTLMALSFVLIPTLQYGLTPDPWYIVVFNPVVLSFWVAAAGVVLGGGKGAAIGALIGLMLAFFFWVTIMGL